MYDVYSPDRYGSKTKGPPKGSVKMGKEGMADDEYFTEWVVPE